MPEGAGKAMCRLFGLSSGAVRVRATFWLLDAPDSLEAQSHRNVDGSGIGFFDADGAPVVDKQPEAAFSDEEFIHEARQAESSAFISHVRWATAGGRTPQNTHPFVMRDRIMAHNGGFGELPRLEEQLGSYASLVQFSDPRCASNGKVNHETKSGSAPRVSSGRGRRLR